MLRASDDPDCCDGRRRGQDATDEPAIGQGGVNVVEQQTDDVCLLLHDVVVRESHASNNVTG